MTTRSPTPDHVSAHDATPLRGWLLGLVAGALGGLLGISWILPLPGIGLLPLVVGILVPPRPFGAAGTLLGWGAIWAALFIRADDACDPASCRGPDITPWLTVSAGLVIAGLCLLAIGLIRSRGRS